MAGKLTAIGAIIKLDGESTFRNSIQNCKSSISAMKSELQNISKSYEGNSNSLEALTAIQEKYAEIQKRAKEQTEKTLQAYEESKKKQDSVKESMEKMKDAYVSAEKKLEQMKESGTASAEALAEQEKATEDAYKAYRQYEAAVEKAETRTGYFQKALADVKGEEIEASEAMKKYASYIEEAKSSTNGVASSIDEYGREVKSAGEAAREGGAGVAVFTGALSANIVTEGLERAVGLLKEGAEFAVEVGSQFEKSQSQVKATSKATADEMAQVAQMAKYYGRTTKFTATDISDGFNSMAQSGWKVNTQLAAMPGVVNLARAADTGLAESAKTVTRYLSTFGLSAEHAVEMADILAYAQANSQAVTEEFAEAWQNSAANMNAANQTLQTTTAILEGLSQSGRVGARAGTSLSAIIRDITNKMSDGAIAIGDTSVSVQDANGDFRDMIDILMDVQDATDGMGSAQRSAALSAVFTSDSISAINMMLDSGVENIQRYKEELNNCGGAAEEMADTMDDNLSGSMANLSSATEGLGNAVYTYIKGPLRGAVDGITDAINDITDVLEPQITEVTLFADKVVEAADRVNNAINSADTDYAAGMSHVQEIQGYIDTIEQARGKTNLTEFEVYKLNSAIKNLSGDVPELNDYIDNTGKLLGLDAEGFEKIKILMTKDYKRVLADVIVAQRNAYAQALVDAENVQNQQQSALEEAGKDAGRVFIDSFKDTSTLDVISILAGNKWELFTKLKPTMDALNVFNDVSDSIDETGETMDAVNEKYDDFLSKFPELQEELGITQDKNGKWITTLDEAGDAAEETGKKASDANKNVSDSSEDMADTVRTAVATYIEETEKMKNADPADVIRDQLAAAAAEVQEFQNTLQSNLQGFSLFGDRSSLVDAYTSTNRDEMKLNMSWALSSMKNYTQELDTLKKRGVSTEFIDYLMSQGQAGLNYVHSLVLASTEELKEFQKMFNEYNSYTSGINENVKNLQTDYAQAISAGVPEGKEAWHKFGIETTAGLFDAINEAAEGLQNGSLTGDITSALQVVLQNKADQVAAQSQAQKTAKITQDRIAAQAAAATESAKNVNKKRSDISDDLRVTVNVTAQNIMDGKKVSEYAEKNAKIKSQITGRR